MYCQKVTDRAELFDDIKVNTSEGNFQYGWDWDKGVCRSTARDGISFGRQTLQVPVGSPLSVRCFQKEKLVITIKRPYYIADFLEKSVFYWAGLQMHTHTLLAARHWNRSEQGLGWEETEKGSGQIYTHQRWWVKQCVCSCAMENIRTAGGARSRVIKENLYREWVSDSEPGHRTHPVNHTPPHRLQRRKVHEGWQRGRARQGESTAGYSAVGLLCGVSVHKLD